MRFARSFLLISTLLLVCQQVASQTTTTTPTDNVTTVAPEEDHDHDHEAEEAKEAAEANERRNAVNGLKGASVALMAVIAGTVWLATYCCHRYRSKLPPVLETIAVAFSAGIFVYIGLAHLLAEGTEILTKVTEERYRASFACCVLMYFVTLLFQRGFGLGEGHSHGGHSHDDEGYVQELTSNASATPPHGNNGGASPTDPANQADPPQGHNEQQQQQQGFQSIGAVSTDNTNDAPAPSHVIASTSDANAPEKTTEAQADHQEEHKGEDHIGAVALTLAAFSLHSFAEGFGLGLQSTVPGTIMIMIAIFSHQWAEVLTFSTFASKKIPNNTVARVILMGLQALICPIGIAVGWGISVAFDTHATIGYALSLASGTFLCIGMSELLPELMDPKQTNFVTWISSVVGAVVILLIQVFTYNPEAHHH